MSTLVLPESMQRGNPSDLIVPRPGLVLPKRRELVRLPDGRTNTIIRPRPWEMRMLPGPVDPWVDDGGKRVREHIERYGRPPIEGGAAGAWTATNNTRTYMLNGTFDWDSDTWKIALFLSTSNIGASSTTFAGVTNEHSGANGYTAGGIATTITLSGTTTVTAAFTQCQWTASGGSIVARFGVLYEVSGNVGFYFLLDSSPADVTVTTGNQLTISAGNVFSLA